MQLKTLVNYKMKCTPAAGSYCLDGDTKKLIFMQSQKPIAEVPTKKSQHIEIRDS